MPETNGTLNLLLVILNRNFLSWFFIGEFAPLELNILTEYTQIENRLLTILSCKYL